METAQRPLKTIGGISILFSAALWGLFWIPMRYFDEAGLSALWSVAAINFVGSLIAVPAALLWGDISRSNLRWLLILGVGMGLSNIFYFSALILTDVVRATLLFYLLPLWATLFSRFFFGVPIGMIKTIGLFLALVGIWLLLGAGGWPIPKNLGDIFGLISGIGWAFGLTMMHGKDDLDPLASTAFALVTAFLAALVLGLILMQTSPEIQPAIPSWENVAPVVLPLAAFAILVLWPTFLGQLWGAKHVVATTAALLTMSEIIVATVSTTALEGNSLEFVSWIGGGFILLAVLADLYGDRRA